MEIESKQCVILVPPCVTRDTSLASTDASQNQLFYYGTHHQYLHDITNADHDDQKNRMVSGGGRGGGGKVVCSGYAKLSKICYCQQINFYVKHLIGTKTVLQQRDFFASYALAASFPLLVPYPFRFSLSRKFLTLLQTKISK